MAYQRSRLGVVWRVGRLPPPPSTAHRIRLSRGRFDMAVGSAHPHEPSNRPPHPGSPPRGGSEIGPDGGEGIDSDL